MVEQMWIPRQSLLAGVLVTQRELPSAYESSLASARQRWASPGDSMTSEYAVLANSYILKYGLKTCKRRSLRGNLASRSSNDVLTRASINCRFCWVDNATPNRVLPAWASIASVKAHSRIDVRALSIWPLCRAK